MNHYGFKHLDRLASTTTVLLWLNLVLTAALNLISLTHPFSKDGSQLSGLFSFLTDAHLALIGITVLSFFWWYYRACANARILNPGILEYGRVDVIACWFIPIVNAITPLFIMMQLWHASLVRSTQLPETSRNLLLFFWVSWLGNIILKFCTTVRMFDACPFNPEFVIATLTILAATVTTTLLTRIIKPITNEQNMTFAVLSSEIAPTNIPHSKPALEAKAIAGQEVEVAGETITLNETVTVRTKQAI